MIGEGDLEACATVVAVMSKIFPDLKLNWLVDEIAPHLPVELDFVNEAKNCKRAGAYFKRWRSVVVPDVIDNLTTERVLTMSFEEGVNATQKEEIEGMGLDAKQTAQLISKAFCAQTFHSGLVPVPRRGISEK